MSKECTDCLPKINLDEPRYDQETYVGRAKHFFETTNPLNLFVSSRKLEEARCLVLKYRCKEPLPCDITEDDLWRAKVLYDSAFHPDTGEKMNIIGRMSAQVPMNMLITGGMLAFYKSTPAVIFWQWLNQSFNALVNYTNRSGDVPFTDKQIATSYVLATSGAVATALSLNRLCRNAPPLLGRLVPLAAVATANCINIPLMRAQELKNGTPVYDECNNKLGYSKNAAQAGISQVIFSRIFMATPGMLLTPVLMNYLERRGTLCRYPWINLPVQIAFLGFCLTFATPLACAFFKQKNLLPYKHLEPELREVLDKKFSDRPPKYVYYNKGL
ncbi:sideroflexin-3 [Asbolus verrucosus]|uniref:Sidoreflexin n=1 Tax=Asbolus verrucosus TaxID=1661398 RepID=A0A482VQ89_ASBVE|nr:sideroflexin-3 [Asbolus verrucosus]